LNFIRGNRIWLLFTTSNALPLTIIVINKWSIWLSFGLCFQMFHRFHGLTFISLALVKWIQTSLPTSRKMRCEIENGADQLLHTCCTFPEGCFTCFQTNLIRKTVTNTIQYFELIFMFLGYWPKVQLLSKEEILSVLFCFILKIQK